MYKRLTILSFIIIAALCGLSWLGYRAIDMWSSGIEGTRIGEFAEVAEQIRQDVINKIDAFMKQEQDRPYTDYQYYSVPENISNSQQQMTLEVSPLAGQLEHGLAFYHFQINPDGSITTPNALLSQQQQAGFLDTKQAELNNLIYANSLNVKDNLLPALGADMFDTYELNYDKNKQTLQESNQKTSTDSEKKLKEELEENVGKGVKLQSTARKQNLTIESLRNTEEAQVEVRSRSNIASNEIQNQENIARQLQQQADITYDSDQVQQMEQQQGYPQSDARQVTDVQFQISATEQSQRLDTSQQILRDENQDDVVEIPIDPFVPVVVPDTKNGQSVFKGQVFMLRRVKIEDKQLLQGFQLNEKKLLQEVEESTNRFIREGMSFELSQKQDENSAYTAILDFVGLGHIILNLIETDPTYIVTQISELRIWYFSIMAVVTLAVTLAVGSLWLNARAQITLAQKKDDFVSAVSHELRTPLTSIRMHAEMLEKDWIKSKDKLSEYYSSMRQESERLSRLIENVLDFSRIQRGRKKFTFKLGDINKCITDVIEMMRPYAEQKGFIIKSELGDCGQISFDSDAVTQIVVNLLDNAVKYAGNAEDKTIIVRTQNDKNFTLIEIEDHGPGIPHRQQKKIFEQFYRIGAEATRETTGSGLGLALVKKFAQAHNGFVEIINVRPTGAIFRIALAEQNPQTG